MTDKEIIKALMQRAEHGQPTAEERKQAGDLCKKYGVRMRGGRCKNCYTDALAECYRVAKQMEEQAESEKMKIIAWRYRFTAPVSVDRVGTYGADTPAEAVERLRLAHPGLFRQLYEAIFNDTPADGTDSDTITDTMSENMTDTADDTTTDNNAGTDEE